MVVVDSATQSRLSGVTGITEICDSSGRLLGHFVPLRDAGLLEPQISGEEIRRRVTEEGGKGRSWAEIRADLQKQA